MPSLILRGLSDQANEVLHHLATSNHRRMGGLERARRWQSLLAGRHFPDPAADIQADRSRFSDGRIGTDPTSFFCT